MKRLISSEELQLFNRKLLSLNFATTEYKGEGFESAHVVFSALSNSARCKSKGHFTDLKENVKSFSIGELSCFVFT